MADVVGTALVRIKALTDKLAKDIEKDVKKGMKDAKLDKIAQAEGEEFGEEFGNSTADSAKKTLGKRAKDIVPSDEISDEFGDLRKDVERQFGQLSFDDAIKGIRENFDQLELEFPEIDDINIDVDVDTDRALNSFQLLQDRLGDSFELPDVEPPEIEFEVDTEQAENAFSVFQRKFDEIRSRAENSRQPIKIFDVDDGALRQSLERDSDALSALGARLRSLRAELREEIEFPDFNLPSLELPFDEGRMSNFFRKLKSDFNDSNADTQRWAGKIRGHFRSVADDAGEASPLSKSLINISKRFKELGSGNGFSSALGLLRSKILLIGGAIAAALPYIQDLGAGILAYATGLTAQIGFIVTAMGGLGVAAAAALGSVALAAGPIALAFKSETDALLDFKDSLGAAGEEFLKIGTATQQTLLPSLDEALNIIGDLVPMFSEFGLFVGASVGDFAKLAANVLTGATAQGRFAEMMRSSLRIMDMLYPILINVGDILSGIWVAALPVAERFVGAIGRLAERWSDMVNQGLRTGELAAKFDVWYDRAELLGSALGNLAGALFDIFSVGADSADGVFARFDEWAESYRSWTESEVGQNKLALIFDNALAVMREVNGIAADLFDGIFGRLGEVGGVDSMVAALQRFRDVIPEIQEFWGNAYGTIKQVVDLLADSAWEKIKLAWDQLAEPLGRLAHQMLELLDVMNESGAFEVFLDLMVILSDTLATLLAIPGFGQFVAYFLAFGGAIKIAGMVLGPFVTAFGPFVGLIGKLLALKAAGALTATGGALAKIAAGAKAVAAANLAGSLAGSAPAVKAAATSAGGLATKLTGVGSVLTKMGPYGIAAAAGVAVVGGAFLLHKKAAQEFDQDVRQATEALGLMNDGLNITAEGVSTYIKEQSRFEGNDQIDDLERMGLSIASLGENVANGTLTYEAFADKALAAGEVFVQVDGRMSGRGFSEERVRSLEQLGRQYDLTAEQMEELARGESVRADGVELSIAGNDSLLESYEELRKVIGAAAKESVDGFVSNTTNIQLLGAQALAEYKRKMDEIDEDDADEAVPIQVAAQKQLEDAARAAMVGMEGLSEATRDQIREQATLADGTVDPVKQFQLMTAELEKQNTQIRANLEAFGSADFGQMNRKAVIDFLTATSDINLPDFSSGLGIDEMVSKFPYAVAATDNLFTALEGMPDEQFNIAAANIGVDSDVLKEAVNGAQQAIIDLQNQAISTLPTVGELLDEATMTDPEGKQTFNQDGFIQGVKEREDEARAFALRLEHIRQTAGEEAAAQAARLGPEAAKNLSEIAGASPDALRQAIEGMTTAETDLAAYIEEKLGPAIRTKYAEQAGLLGGEFGQSLAGGLNSPETLAALNGASLDTLNKLGRLFRGQFVIENGVLSFRHTGQFIETDDGLTPGQRRMLRMATGGYVDTYGIAGTFNKSFGSDTVPAMLTPGEFVINRANVDRLGVDFYNSLNEGGTPAVPVGVGGSPINANGWTIVAPDPQESARQMISRFRSMSFLLG